MKREDVVPTAALVVLAGQKIQELCKQASGEDQIELLDALNAINYAAHVLADLIPEKEANQ